MKYVFALAIALSWLELYMIYLMLQIDDDFSRQSHAMFFAFCMAMTGLNTLIWFDEILERNKCSLRSGIESDTPKKIIL